jgi:NAD(P)-dependent dehydrogenase (short-subunit alcohol dehydrogenase family)
MTPAERNDDGEIVEPPNSTVGDWLGQQASADDEEVDELLDETDGDVGEAERRFPERSHADRPDRLPTEERRTWPVGRTVLVTGAGSGIGVATAVEAARLGFRAVAAVHRPEQLPDVHAAAAEAGVEVDAEVLDVTDDGATGALVDRIEPWAVVASAGFMNPGLIEDVPIDDARHQLEVMLLAPARLAQIALPGMRRRGGGRIVVLSSPLGEVSLPLRGWYSATKRALSALCDALRVEVVADAVDVVLVEPGAAATPLWDEARAVLAERRARSARPEVYDRGIVLQDGVQGRAADPTVVAEVVGTALRAAHPRFRYRTPAAAVPFAVAARVVPTSVRDRVVRALGAV